MTVHGIGIDVVEVARIAAAIARHGESFLARLFTPTERAYCDAKKSPAIHYAARFAAKEAVAKALGTGIGTHASWLDLEVCHAPGGAPALKLHSAAAAYASAHGITDIQISLTHTHAHAAANAIALKKTQD
ncbi:MAG: holo-[acyl-carrier-protein] synthase [Verrucomicrobia bacterium]|nr:MAG: holo-[acyl-carrier-protein] synthase [Verrucomicrobiota bacterium]